MIITKKSGSNSRHLLQKVKLLKYSFLFSRHNYPQKIQHKPYNRLSVIYFVHLADAVPSPALTYRKNFRLYFIPCDPEYCYNINVNNGCLF